VIRQEHVVLCGLVKQESKIKMDAFYQIHLKFISQFLNPVPKKF